MATAADADAFASIYSEVVTGTAITFETVPPDGTEMARRFEEYSKVGPWLAYESDDVVLGYAYASRFRPRAAYRWCVEASAYLAPEARAAGVGTRLLRLLVRLLTLQGYQSLYGVVALPNPQSERVCEKLGMKRVGVLPKSGYKLGRWHDVAQWHMELNPAVPNPQEPLKPSECAHLPEWQAAFEQAQAGS